MSMKNRIVEETRKFVEKECEKPGSKYGYEAYINHFIPMHKYAKILAEKMKADIEVVEIAAWLHDIGSIIYGRENHHITGAEIAEKKLKELNYPEEKTELVKKCILNHRGSFNNKKESKEEQIIADADAASAFEHIEGQFYAAFVSEKKNQEEAKKSVINKLENCYNKLSEEARKLIKNRYEAAKLLFGEE